MSASLKPKRGPSVLVTDARDQSQQRPVMAQSRSSARLISVDNVLQYASEIPSGQRRGPPRPMHHRTPSGKRPLDPKLSGRLLQQHVPSRSSKVSEKLVLLPDAEEADEEKGEFGLDRADEDQTPPRDGDAERRGKPATMKEKSYAERLPKSSRTEKLSRVTAYCTAQAYKMRATAEYVRTRHGAKTKLYDDCLYTVYHLPLLPGNEGYRIRSSPVLKSPGGKAVLDEEIERNERHEYREGYFGEERYGVRDRSHSPKENRADGESNGRDQPQQPPTDEQFNTELSQVLQPPLMARSSSPGSNAQLAASIATFAEMFVFTYGVVVFWNFTERQEKDILADLTFSFISPIVSPSDALRSRYHKSPLSTTTATTPTPQSLTIRPLDESDFETEEFHFEYNPEIPRPRVFNDMITLRSADHMIKLAMSHAIAQSTKLSFFEERMAETMEEAQHVPRRLALKGELGMKREEVVRMVGRLFKSRVDVNLCKLNTGVVFQFPPHTLTTSTRIASPPWYVPMRLPCPADAQPPASNMLDVPNFFWDSEPTLHPLYAAVREYLEIKPRIQVLNERCRVFLDLAEILTDSINDRKMSRLTWIIIILIVLSILVTCSEVFLRFGLLSSSSSSGRLKASAAITVARWLSGHTASGRAAAAVPLVGGLSEI